jgi:hypothetical protein
VADYRPEGLLQVTCVPDTNLRGVYQLGRAVLGMVEADQFPGMMFFVLGDALADKIRSLRNDGK